MARIGVLMRSRRISGGNPRAVAMLNGLIRFFEDFTPMPFKSIEKHLEAEINIQFDFLTHCRPHNISMGNVLRFIKAKLHSTTDLGSDELIEDLVSAAGHFIQERIVCAVWQIALYTARHGINEGDHIVIHGNNSAVRLTLLAAAKVMKKKFRVTVVSNTNSFSGKSLACQLEESGIEVNYTLLNSLGAFVQDCHKVFLGAGGVLANGCLLSRVGSASVAAQATHWGKPVYVLAESYKCTDRAVPDPLAHNVLDDPSTLIDKDVPLDEDGEKNRIVQLKFVFNIIDQTSYLWLVTEEGFTQSEDVPHLCARKVKSLIGADA
eukprot:CAMPEP_0113854564 /NCGR_PEP_ID=MMETSP0372-20130328/7449_1 /TAXON_ID=340204 /ORGANISM="Lankesteria abbotti" /LENGTH=320 /DNA_ID=CAMNT_0000827865 /DNA_START=536 /DNA_END=1498 /DNA_ORIENTATION=- /assembly_acc=CAM_ASM_000359